MKKYFILFLLSLTAIPGGAAEYSQPGNDVQKVYHAQAFGQLPLHFEANRGQFDDGVEYFSRGIGFSLFLTANEAVFSIQIHKYFYRSYLRIRHGTHKGGTILHPSNEPKKHDSFLRNFSIANFISIS
ncbi:MAG: hypothetical protein AB1656_17005 [Candidatus Omnitrophota bacterium]